MSSALASTGRPEANSFFCEATWPLVIAHRGDRFGSLRYRFASRNG